MILDKGICTMFRKTDVSTPGGKPTYTYTLIHKSWYGETSFATVRYAPTESRTEIQTDAKIRVYENRQLQNHDMVVLADVTAVPANGTIYEISRIYHGADDDSGVPISDLSLVEVRP